MVEKLAILSSGFVRIGGLMTMTVVHSMPMKALNVCNSKNVDTSRNVG